MFSTVSDNKYNELKNVFGKLPLSQAFVVTAFALERLWQPFVEGISDCAYTEQERQEVLQLEKKILDIIWTHILFEDTQVDHWQEFCKLYDQIEEVSAEVDLNFMAKPYYCAIVDFAGWCLKGNPARAVNRVRPDIVINTLDFIIDCVSAEITQCNEDKMQDILSTHPLVLAEMERIDADIQMAKDYSDNTDLILRRKAEYHAINISHI